MWKVSPAFPGTLSVIGFSGSGLVFMSVVSLNTNVYVASYTTQASSRRSKQLMSFSCLHLLQALLEQMHVSVTV